MASASAQAQIEIAIKNLGSLNKLDKTLDKLNKTNQQLIRGIERLTTSIDSLSRTKGFDNIGDSARQASRKVKTFEERLKGVSGFVKNLNLVKRDPFVQATQKTVSQLRGIERLMAAPFMRADKDSRSLVTKIGQIFQLFQRGKASITDLVAGITVFLAKTKDVAENWGLIPPQILIVKKSLSELEVILNNARKITRELPTDNENYRGSVLDVLFAEKQVNRELLERKRILEALTVEQRAFRDKINRTNIESRNRRSSGAFSGGFADFNRDVNQEKINREARKEYKNSLFFAQSRIKANKARLESMQMADREIDFERRLNEVLAKRQTIYNKLGFGKDADSKGIFASQKGMGGRLKGAASSAMIGGGFPLLFGQGGAGALGGGIGGAVGGMLGGGFGFGLSILGTALADIVVKTSEASEALAGLNGRFKGMGETSKVTAKDITEVSKALGKTRAEARELIGQFASFGQEESLIISKIFGNRPELLEAFTTITDMQSALNAIETISKDISKEVEFQLVSEARFGDLGKVRVETQRQILRSIKEQKLEQLKTITLAEKLGATGQRILGVLTFGLAGDFTTATTKAREEIAELLKDLEEFDKITAEILEKTDKKAAALASRIPNIGEALRDVDLELEKLGSRAFQVISAAEAISGAFSESFKGIISGTMSVQQAFANMFQRIADHFLDMAAQMAATQLKKGILSMFANIGTNALTSSALSGATLPTDVGGLTTKQAFSGDLKYFSSGGYVTSPTVGLVGEAGEDEYVIPASKMASSMQRYSAGARGDAVIAGGGSSYAGGGAGGSTTVSYSGPILNFNSEEFVPKSAVGQIIASAAKQGASMGETRTMKSMQNNRSARARIGM